MRQRDRDSDRERERQRDRERGSERRERETEIQGDRETERQRERRGHPFNAKHELVWIRGTNYTFKRLIGFQQKKNLGCKLPNL